MYAYLFGLQLNTLIQSGRAITTPSRHKRKPDHSSLPQEPEQPMAGQLVLTERKKRIRTGGFITVEYAKTLYPGILEPSPQQYIFVGELRHFQSQVHTDLLIRSSSYFKQPKRPA